MSARLQTETVNLPGASGTAVRPGEAVYSPGEPHSFAQADSLLEGLEDLWQKTHGDQHICVAILDGPVDLAHEAFDGSEIQVVEGPAPAGVDDGPACRHGTHVEIGRASCR